MLNQLFGNTASGVPCASLCAIKFTCPRASSLRSLGRQQAPVGPHGAEAAASRQTSNICILNDVAHLSDYLPLTLARAQRPTLLFKQGRGR